MDKEAFRKLLVQWASEDVYINQLTWEEGDALAEYLAKWYAAQQKRAVDAPCAECGGAFLHKEGCSQELSFYETAHH